MLLITATDEWRTAHPGTVIGLLELSGLENTHSSPKLDERKRETEARLRERYNGFSRQDFLSLPVMSAYEQYYKRFNKTYHVQLQVESIVLKGKSLPNSSKYVRPVDGCLPQLPFSPASSGAGVHSALRSLLILMLSC